VSSPFWAYVEALPETGVLVLSPEESRHVAARRLRAGDVIVAFDGRGRQAPARVERIGRRDVELVVLGVETTPAPSPPFVLASAIPKGERLATMLPMLTQLGVDVWQPLELEDSAVRRIDPEAPRMRRILIESCKVARRAWTLVIEPVCALESLLAKDATGPVVYGDREGLRGGLDAATRLVVIGPEAGFSEREHRALREAGATPHAFAPHNLRIETAAIAGAVAAWLARGERAGGTSAPVLAGGSG